MDERTFNDEIQSPEINVPRAALLFAREIAYPDLDVEVWLGYLDDLADAGRAFLQPSQSVIEQAEALGDFLFVHERFQGNVHEYNDPAQQLPEPGVGASFGDSYQPLGCVSRPGRAAGDTRDGGLACQGISSSASLSRKKCISWTPSMAAPAFR